MLISGFCGFSFNVFGVASFRATSFSGGFCFSFRASFSVGFRASLSFGGSASWFLFEQCFCLFESELFWINVFWNFGIVRACSTLTGVEESEKYFNAIGIADYGSEKEIKAKVDEIVALIKKNKAPTSLDELDNNLNYEHPSHIKAVASISKLLATLNDLWGLAKWPTVNPKNIRDKIYVVLEEKREPMHFEEIAEAIKGSDFRRKNVTIQAIHNELIKDPRFVLIGRGIYALDSWGYKKGTVSETISDVLKQAKKPLSREQIVKRVLALRKVKETTILLNLQNKKLFKKVDKNSYTIAE